MLNDSRTIHTKKTKRSPMGTLEMVYCIHCGAEGGWVTQEHVNYVLYQCVPCSERWPKLPLPLYDPGTGRIQLT